MPFHFAYSCLSVSTHANVCATAATCKENDVKQKVERQEQLKVYKTKTSEVFSSRARECAQADLGPWVEGLLKKEGASSYVLLKLNSSAAHTTSLKRTKAHTRAIHGHKRFRPGHWPYAKYTARTQKCHFFCILHCKIVILVSQEVLSLWNVSQHSLCLGRESRILSHHCLKPSTSYMNAY